MVDNLEKLKKLADDIQAARLGKRGGATHVNSYTIIDEYHEWRTESEDLFGKYFDKSNAHYETFIGLPRGGNGFVLMSYFDQQYPIFKVLVKKIESGEARKQHPKVDSSNHLQPMKDKYIQILQEQIDKLSVAKTFDFEIWKYETINILSEVFGKDSTQEEQLKTIKYDWGGLGIGDSFHSWDNLETCVAKSKQLLTSFIQHLNKFGTKYETLPRTHQPISEGGSPPNEKRLALVIGNSNYKNTPALANPINDADEMTTLLTSLNFKVIKHHDLNWQGMKKAVDEFGKELENYDVGLLFFAGHGLQINGRNFLVPIEFELISENRVEYETVDAQWTLSVMQDANVDVNIIILDACRNNPFEIKGGKRSVNVGRGLASMNAPLGTIIAYSTAPGNTADDGTGKNGLYTEFLLKNLPLENILIEQAFKLTRKDVMLTSSNEQIPWESTSLTGDFYMKNK